METLHQVYLDSLKLAESRLEQLTELLQNERKLADNPQDSENWETLLGATSVSIEKVASIVGEAIAAMGEEPV